jgi:hypothetical protein
VTHIVKIFSLNDLLASSALIVKYGRITKKGEQGTGNREQGTDKKQKLLSFKSRKRFFKQMRSPKKTVLLFQSHVFKHEFFLFTVASSSEISLGLLRVLISMRLI